MPNYQQTAKRAAKVAKQQMISSICEELDNVKESNSGVLKYGIVSNLIHSYSSAAPNMKVTRHDVRNMLKKRSNYRAITTITAPNTEVTLEDPPITNTIVAATSRGNGGRPKGGTKYKHLNCKVALITAKNDIAILYADEKKRANNKKKRMRKGRLAEIISKVKRQGGLPDKVKLSPKVIQKRVDRGGLIVMNEKGSGQVSPLLEIEPQFVQVVIPMARIGDPLAPTKDLELIHDMIAGTKYQDLVKSRS
mmetsp:Transcript_31321/g.37267  ORF Transcript_31321/g.37267 Transcript_31321/m.37267 type:complete len:250 (-) Transcript_31321:858-1607(-)